jgi:uncharacterized protein with PIN domain/sulfur carrier protein ThiS
LLNVTLRLYAELNDFVPPAKRQRTLPVALRERDSVKDVIESQGVPHTEVDLIVVNGEPVGFDYRVRDGDRIAAYPVFRSLDVSSLPALRPPAWPRDGEPRFVLDAHLGTLAGLLRMLGFDTLYRNDYDDADLARISAEEGRILLTRDRGLLKRRQVVHGYHVWATDAEAQVAKVLRRFGLSDLVRPFSRCLRCNGPLTPVAKEVVLDRLEPLTRRYYDEFAICSTCDQVYWRGSHFQRMQGLVERLRPAQATHQ